MIWLSSSKRWRGYLTAVSRKSPTRRSAAVSVLVTHRPSKSERFRVEAKACGFKSGVDPLKLNQVYDDLEIERLGTTDGFRVHEP